MDDDGLNDLKEFITVTVSQRITDVRDDIKNLDEKLSKKIDDLSESVAVALSDSNDEVEKQLADHKKRITKLESVAQS